MTFFSFFIKTHHSIMDLPKQPQHLVDQTLGTVWGAYTARLLSTWRKVCLSGIYYSFIWFNHVRIINQKKHFWFVYRFKIKFAVIVYCIRFFFVSEVILILLPAETISVTLVISCTFILNLCLLKFKQKPPDRRLVDNILY